MSYLRLSRPDYIVIRRECLRLRLGRRARSAFRSELIAALVDRSPLLAGRVAGMRRSEIDLIHAHFRELSQPVAEEVPPTLSPSEWIAFAEACTSYPLPVRFVRPFRHMLIDLFRDVSPQLAKKLEALSAAEFEQLYEQATERKKGSA